ncbi:hypothetical protein P261_00367 [Lachnospiraceae bacterium TWA4]|nr:hypothetical protein P261_00367 [Lachnospiraceae bacterium TWA4]
MMMSKSNEFMNRLKTEITSVVEGLHSPQINIHIFSGLSGGTGAGCFLDTCYMVRAVAEELGKPIKSYGYFFLPDVNLKNVPLELNAVHDYIPKNGYASLQELEYCMNISQNGGEFIQEYNGGKRIKWNRPPVDMCHLVSASDSRGNVIPNAYKYSMNVVAEYIMDFLTKAKDKDEFGLDQHFENFQAFTGAINGKKRMGANIAYCAIGASCATIPLKEINTYLASRLFEQFATIQGKTPTKSDVDALAFSTLATGDVKSLEEVYESLYAELRQDASSEYEDYREDFHYVRDAGNSEMVLHYTNQTSDKEGNIERNATGMEGYQNAGSLLGRIRKELEVVLKDIDRGPMFAYGMLQAGVEYNLSNFIDGLIVQNKSRLTKEASQDTNREEDYQNAKDAFEDIIDRKIKMPGATAKAFETYKFYLMTLEQHKLDLVAYKTMDRVLNELKKQVDQIAVSYYLKLSNVMTKLIETFNENKRALDSQDVVLQKEEFVMPMMTIKEIQPALEERIKKINIRSMMDAFMNLLVEHEEDWIGENDNRISRLVINFFVHQAFRDFATRTITEFLRDKYERQIAGEVTDEVLTNFIYEDWIKKLTARANPLFTLDSTIWQESQTTKMAFLSVPQISAPIQAAAAQIQAVEPIWKSKMSALTDRIFVMQSVCGFPLSAYREINQYEGKYFSSKNIYGRHYYEEKSKCVVKIDWRNLLPLRPQSVTNREEIYSEDLKMELSELDRLYSKACEIGVIDENSRICKSSESDCKTLADVLAEATPLLKEDYLSKNLSKLVEAIENIDHCMTKIQNYELSMSPTEYALPQDGLREREEDIKDIQKDYFYSFPIYQLVVKEILDSSADLLNDKQETLNQLEAKKAEIQGFIDQLSEFDYYCYALFTGVFKVQFPVISCSIEEFDFTFMMDHGLSEDIMLSTVTDEFGSIPFYQSFVTYQGLDKEIKQEIRRISDERRSKLGVPEAKVAVEELKSQLTNERLKNYVQMSLNTTKSKEIMDFLGKINRKFKEFCALYGL